MTAWANESDEALIVAAQRGDTGAMDAMAQRHDALTKFVAKRYLGRGLEFDDLHQLGRLGLIKAIRNFDLRHGVRFSTYAVPVIMGEIRRCLRDEGQVHVSRTIRENAQRIRRASSEQEGLSVQQLSERLSLSTEDVMLAMESTRRIRSLSEPVGDDGTLVLQDTLGEDMMPEVLKRLELQNLLDTLDEDERRLIVKRYFMEQTQTAIADELNMSQVQVSRLESRILKRLREIAG